MKKNENERYRSRHLLIFKTHYQDALHNFQDTLSRHHFQDTFQETLKNLLDTRHLQDTFVNYILCFEFVGLVFNSFGRVDLGICDVF